MTETLRSIQILDSLATQFRHEYPDHDVPEELIVCPALVDSAQKYFCQDGENLKADQIPPNIEMFIVDTFDNDCHWKHLKVLLDSASKDTITALYLGHDGCIFGEKTDIESVISGLPKLQVIHYCGYYVQYEESLLECCERYGVQAVEIY